MSELKRRARYTRENKLEAVRLVKGGQAADVTVMNWASQAAPGELGALIWQGSAQVCR
jgi:hypothetical protein